MKKYLLLITLLAGFSTSTTVVAGQASAALGACMVDALTGKERKQLAQWIFFGMSAHPEIKAYSKITPANRNNTDQTIGHLITRLLTQDCPAETVKAMEKESNLAMQSAFELVGRVAMQELMTSQDVNLAMAGFEKYMDKEKFEALNSKK